MYKLSKSVITGQIKIVLKEIDGMLYSIPFDPENTDYQAFLRWCEEGNTPLPASDE